MHTSLRWNAALLLGLFPGLQACGRTESARHEPRAIPTWYEARTEGPLSARELAPPEVSPKMSPEAGTAEPQQQQEPTQAEAPAALPKGKPESFGQLPFSPPPIPAYRIPRASDCDWILRDGVARSTRDLGELRAADHDGYLLAPAYSASMRDRQENPGLGADRPVIFGVYGDAGGVVLAGGWSLHSPRSLFWKNRAGEFTDIKVSIVGLDPRSEVRISWDRRWGWPSSIGLFNIGLRGNNDSFVIRANEGVGKLIIDGCWWLACKQYAGTNQRHASGMHIDKWDVLVWRNHLWRGKNPGSPGIDLREHSAYLKSARGGTWIVGNDLRGGNRTGFQIRPEPGKNELPKGDLVIAYNYAKGYGWNNGSSKATYDGGSCITVWSNPNASTYVFGNRITDAKYGCLTITAQGDDKNWLGESGFPIGPVYLHGNTFENKRGDRAMAAITSAEEVHIFENDFQGQLILNDQWGMTRHGIANGPTYLRHKSLLKIDLWTFDPRTKGIRRLKPRLSEPVD